MSIIPMKKLTLIGLNTEKKLILEALHYTNAIELKKTSDIEDTDNNNSDELISEIQNKVTDLQFAIDFIEEKIVERKRYAKKDSKDDFLAPKSPLFFVRRSVTFEEFVGITMNEYEIFSSISKLKSQNSRLIEIKAETTRLENQIQQLKAYMNIDTKFSEFISTKNVEMAFGLVPTSSGTKYIDKIHNNHDYIVVEADQNAVTIVAFVACLKEFKDKMKEDLGDCGFVACPFSYDLTAKEKIEEINERIQALEEERIALMKDVSSNTELLEKAKLLFDYYDLELKKAVLEGDFKCTAKTFILEGWFPITCEDIIKKAIYMRTKSVQLFVDEPKEDEEPPTMTKNIKIVTPYESVTNLYSIPKAREKDPNIFVGIFFFIFFGIMLGDAGYGLLLATLTFILLKFFKMEKGMKQLLLVVLMGGISTFIWGTVLGTWFGFDVSEVPILGNLTWFNPIDTDVDGPIKMLGVCIGLGVFQILFGMGVKAVHMIKAKKYFDAFADVGSWYLFFLGIGFIALSMVFDGNSIMQMIGFVLIGLGLGIVLFTAGRHKKGIFGKIIGGFGGLYNIVNYLSDILSYSRLFGLGIATGVIGMAMNTLAGLFIGSWFTMPFAVIVFIIGHIFNLSINLLGAYIHNARLQYVEFLPKFYEGGGYEFSPLGADTKYVVISSDNKI